MDAPDSPMTDDSSLSSANPLLSPPGSQNADSSLRTPQPPRSMPVSSSSANANGKRPLNHISNGLDTPEDDAERIARAGVAGVPETTAARPQSSDANAPFVPQVHAASGYRWERAEDAPGYGWSNKKAQDEYDRAWEGLVHKDYSIKARYGDPIELAEHEAAVRASLQK